MRIASRKHLDPADVTTSAAGVASPINSAVRSVMVSAGGQRCPLVAGRRLPRIAAISQAGSFKHG